MMKLDVISGVIIAVLAVSGCSQLGGTPAAPPAQAASDCATPESGIIRPESAGMPEIKLTGPFQLQMLQARVDPANPHGGAIFWSNQDSAIWVDQFKGPFFLAEGETLTARPGFLDLGAVYSGCRMK